MKFGFVCPQVPGHLNPLTALARHLQMRGHDVGVSLFIRCSWSTFYSRGRGAHIKRDRAEMSKKQGDEALKFSMGLIMSQSESMIKSLPAPARNQ
jgi:hypothetical protein